MPTVDLVATSDPDSIRERLAALYHEQWSGWMAYLYGRLSSGGLDQFYEGPNRVIELSDYNRWQRQISTLYIELPENEKDSDRKEADRLLAFLDTLSVESPDPRSRWNAELVDDVRQALQAILSEAGNLCEQNSSNSEISEMMQAIRENVARIDKRLTTEAVHEEAKRGE